MAKAKTVLLLGGLLAAGAALLAFTRKQPAVSGFLLKPVVTLPTDLRPDTGGGPTFVFPQGIQPITPHVELHGAILNNGDFPLHGFLIGYMSVQGKQVTALANSNTVDLAVGQKGDVGLAMDIATGQTLQQIADLGPSLSPVTLTVKLMGGQPGQTAKELQKLEFTVAQFRGTT